MADAAHTSPIMAALMQVGAATEAQISQTAAALRDSLSGTSDTLRKIIDENFQEFEQRTAGMSADHEALKQEGDANIVRVCPPRHPYAIPFCCASPLNLR